MSNYKCLPIPANCCVYYKFIVFKLNRINSEKLGTSDDVLQHFK